MNTIRVLVVDDHAAVRAGLRALLGTASDIQVIGEAENGHQAVRQAERLRPDVVLLDVAMPRLNGLEAARQIACSVPTARVLILSSYSDAQHVQKAVEAGVTGYLMKQSAGDDLLGAIRETRDGTASFSPELFKHLLQAWRQGLPAHRGTATGTRTLTGRQTQVLQLVAEGYCNKQMAELLSLKEKTVEKHRCMLMEKLGCHNTAALTRIAVRDGVVELNSIPDQTPRWPTAGSPWLAENLA